MTDVSTLKFGLDTFGDMTLDDSGKPQTAAAVLRNVVAQAVAADEVGIDHFNIGEHHRDDFSVTAPDTVLAGIATVTKNIILGTGVTVLSSKDSTLYYSNQWLLVPTGGQSVWKTVPETVINAPPTTVSTVAIQ